MNTKPLKTALFLILICISFSLLPMLSLAGSFNGWIYQNPYPTSNTLLAVKFVTPKKGWIVGEKGTILYTEDGGDTWEAQESGTEQDIRSIFFINEKLVWAVGTGGITIHTEDGGKTWVSQGNATTSLNKVFFANEKEGWAVGMNGLVLHTTDGGKKWERQEIGIKRAIASINFINPQTGWIIAGDEVYRTADGGKNWEKSQLEIKIPKSGKVGQDDIVTGVGEGIPDGWWIGDIVFTNENEGWAVIGYWYIFHTEDGGKTWTDQLQTGYMSYGLNAISFMDKKNGCAGGSSLICTEDGGKTWKERLGIKPGQRKMIKEFDVAVSNIQFLGSDTGWAVGTEGQIFKTEDGGKNWNMEARRSECGGNTFFIDEKTGWLYGFYGHDVNTYICRTDDGGHTWDKQELGFKVWDIFFIDSSTGWAAGWLEEIDLPEKKKTYQERKGKILAVIKGTSDGGKTWSTQFKELISKDLLDRGFYSIHFINHHMGWAAGEKGIIVHTDDGKNWKHQRKRDRELSSIGGVKFIDNKIGWAVGNKSTDRLIGVLLYTKDGGEHWQTYKEYKDIYLDSVYFVDKMWGWVMGKTEDEDAYLFYTTDGGKTWSKNESKNIIYGNPAFLDKDRGVIVSENGFLLVTKNGGKTWTPMRTPIAKYPWHFSEIFENKGN